MSWTTWNFEPLPLAAAAVALILFAGGFLRLRRRAGARYADGWRVPLFVLALALATVPVISPLDQAGDEYLLSAHMLQHVLLGDAAPALALVALWRPAALFRATRFGPACARTPAAATRRPCVAPASPGQPG